MSQPFDASRSLTSLEQDPVLASAAHSGGNCFPFELTTTVIMVDKVPSEK
jgi:hypothetical protein